jgi:hypothetical protein
MEQAEVNMKHVTVSQLESIASIVPKEDIHRPPMTRAERLQRWAELLERQPERRLVTLSGTEHVAPDLRAMMRAKDSPISVAFEDPQLRAEGLSDDSYGEAKRFFELTDWQLHEIVCHCYHGARMPASAASRGIRRAIGGPWLLAWFRRIAMHASV